MRRLLTIAAAVLAIVLGGSFALWHWAEGQMTVRVAAWTEAQQAQGLTVSHDPPTSGGWPLAVELTLPNLSLSGLVRNIPGGMAWTGERVTLNLSVLHPRVVRAFVEGGQTLRLGTNAPVAFTADRFVLSAPLETQPHAVALDAGGLHFASGHTVGLLQGQLERQPEAAEARLLRLTAEAIAFPPPPAPQPPLGGHIASATVEGLLTGELTAPASDPAAAATAWQASGGKVDVRRIAVGWGPLGVSGTASLSLDQALQPHFDAKLHLVGYEAALQSLTAAHAVTPNAARAVGAVLALLASPPAGGGASAVDVPLTLHDRMLSMGHIPLGKLPELVWPNGAGPAIGTP